jgi:hypothetical protein
VLITFFPPHFETVHRFLLQNRVKGL